VVVANWYGGGERTVEVTSATAVWYHTGLPPVPLRWVLVRAIRKESSRRKPYYAPTLARNPRES
jgi:hypothetical protein